MARMGNNRSKACGLLREFRIKKAPVDIVFVALGLGFEVIYAELDDSMGGHLNIEGGKKNIIINKTHPLTKQRFSISHEIGHFVNGHFLKSNYSMDTSFDYKNPQHQQEKEADLFASEILMPKHFLTRDAFSNTRDNLSKLYQVSQEAMNIRLSVLKIFPKLD